MNEQLAQLVEEGTLKLRVGGESHTRVNSFFRYFQ